MGNRVYLSGYDPLRDLRLGPKPFTREWSESGLCAPELETQDMIPFGWLALFGRDSVHQSSRSGLWLVTIAERAHERLAARRRALEEATRFEDRYVLRAFATKLVPLLQPCIALRLGELEIMEPPGRFVYYVETALTAIENDPKRFDPRDYAIARLTGEERTGGALYGYGKDWPPAKTEDDEERDLMRALGHAEEDLYATSRTYEPGDALVHPRFGYGLVERVRDDGSIDVLFDDGRKTLVHGDR